MREIDRFSRSSNLLFSKTSKKKKTKQHNRVNILGLYNSYSLIFFILVSHWRNSADISSTQQRMILHYAILTVSYIMTHLSTDLQKKNQTHRHYSGAES